MSKKLFLVAVIMMAILFESVSYIYNNKQPVFAAKPEVKVAWSIYVGWMPWQYASAKGIIKKWGDKYGVNLVLMNKMSYLPSVELYISNQAGACVMTNMECLDMPAASGIKSSAIIVGDYSNGNDAIIVTKDATSLKGGTAHLVVGSVSHYLLSRYLTMNNMTERDVKLENVTNEDDIAPMMLSGKINKTITWNPIVMRILTEVTGAKKIFDSSQIPGEILDLLVVRTDILEENPDVGKALVGAWYEVMAIMSKRNQEQKAAFDHMAAESGCNRTMFENQLTTTMMYWTSNSANEYYKSAELKDKMNIVRHFCFEHNLLGESAKNVDVVGIKYPDGTIQGDPKKVNMIFDNTYTEMHANGQIK